MPPRTRNRISNYREQGGFLVFRIAASPDFQATVSELRQRIPSWARRFDSQTNEWRVKVEYRDVVEEIFGPSPIPNRGRTEPRERYERAGQRGQWLWILLTVAIIATVGALIWSRDPSFETEARPQPTSAAQAISATPASARSDTARVNATANLREGPGTNYAVQGQAKAGDVVKPEARALADDGFWWLRLVTGVWIRSDLVVSNDDSGLPLNLSALPDVGTESAQSEPSSAAAVQTAAPLATLPPPIEGDARGVVTWIYDGDTASVRVDGVDYKVRYLGIDAPEIDMPGHDEATNANRALVMGQTVLLRKDVTNVDRYGRLLRYVYLEDDTFVNEAIVEQGWATATDFPPDTAFIDQLMGAQERARRQGFGIWAN